jgi:predicted nucleic acid-binding protein
MGIVIDTNIFIDAENDRFNLAHLSKFQHHGTGFISVITVSELLAGVHMAKSTSIRIQRSAFVETIINKMPILAFSEEIARTYAELYSHFIKAKNKQESNVHDLQIAATAITHGYAVLSSNIKDFKKIPGLQVESP